MCGTCPVIFPIWINIAAMELETIGLLRVQYAVTSDPLPFRPIDAD